ncbi:uncharacterized protein LTR77_008502 [Saxophila tyrrhenica]|uniref:Uncharacterized protein n=1 Tax=Saxophila tyrrhenica TaxID=1690608 RepID=A0AAV9P1Y1_9PEZI|nr:hypothetical protein LTR77_008502 [Saxophila tyrrhenica]
MNPPPTAHGSGSFDEHTLDEGCSAIRFAEATAKTLDLYIFASGSTDVFESEIADDNALQAWIKQGGVYDRATSRGPVAAGLRLLCLLDHKPSGFKLKPEVLKSMIKSLGLPQSYPTDSVSVRVNGRQYVTDPSSTTTSQAKDITMYFISPSFRDNEMDLALSYSSTTRITHGVLVMKAAPHSPLQTILTTLRRSPALSCHPLLLPALACNAWIEITSDQYCGVHEGIREVQRTNDLMPTYFLGEKQDRGKDYQHIDQSTVQEKHRLTHERIVQQHNYLLNGLSYFVKDFVDALEGAMNHPALLQVEDGKREEMQRYIERLERKMRVGMNFRERLFGKLEMQVQALYTLMQQHDSRTNIEIATQTKRDSSAMKTLSLVSVIFLPLTAVASVFSMDPFVSRDASEGSRVIVSSQFWIYWAVVIPLTSMILCAWVVWINREQLLSRRKVGSRKQQQPISDKKV